MSQAIKKLLLFVALVILIFTLLMWHWPHAARPVATAVANTAAQPAISTVQVVKIQTQNIPQTVHAYAQTISADSVAVAAHQAGVVSKLYVTPGQSVTKGQLLLIMQLNDVAMQPAGLRVKMLQTQHHYQRLYDANKQVKGVVTRDDLESAQSDFEQAQAAYQTAVAATHISAPMAGRVTATTLAVGSSVTAGQTLFNIVTTSGLQLSYNLPSEYLSQAKVGQQVSFTPSNARQVYTGQVSYVAPQLQTAGDSFALRADLRDMQGLRPNQFGQVSQILQANVPQLVIPQKLVQTDEQGFYVYGVAAGKVTKLYFQPGSTTAQGMVVVQRGISAGAAMIVSDPSQLSVGQRVQVTAPAASSVPAPAVS